MTLARKEAKAMFRFKFYIRYARYVLTALSCIGFAIRLN